jgi:hypothetical protein
MTTSFASSDGKTHLPVVLSDTLTRPAIEHVADNHGASVSKTFTNNRIRPVFFFVMVEANNITHARTIKEELEQLT